MFFWIGNNIYETVGMTILLTTVLVISRIMLSKLFTGGKGRYRRGPRHRGRAK